MWDLPRPGIEPVTPALAGEFLTTELPGKSSSAHFLFGLFVFVFWLLSCMSSLYILDINPYKIYGLQTFFPFCKLPFRFVDGFFCCAEAFSLMQSQLFIFIFVAFAFGVKSKKTLPRPM